MQTEVRAKRKRARATAMFGQRGKRTVWNSNTAEDSTEVEHKYPNSDSSSLQLRFSCRALSKTECSLQQPSVAHAFAPEWAPSSVP